MDDDRLFVVGIGASAGGIEAFEGLFRPMPADTGMAFVVLAHLAPHKSSMLDEIIGRFTPMPVAQAQEGVAVEADHIYVLPPDSALTIEEGYLRLHPLAAFERVPHPVDVFFSSLADACGDHAIGIVLSGGGSDGTLGVKAIKERGGLTVAQGSNSSSPRHGGMPSSAIASGLIDLVVPVEDIAGRLVGYKRSFVPAAHLVSGLSGETPEAREETARREICAVLRTQVGHDFSGYKAKTFLRRVQRRMQVVQLGDLAGYLERLRQDPEEVTLLFRDLLIGVTGFFRDSEAFAALAPLIPRLLEGKDLSNPLRVWVPGCATGEEVFSIALLLREHMATLDVAPKVQIFGTDIDEPALMIARAGRYPLSAVDGVSQDRLSRFFTHEAATYQLVKEVRDMCIFSTHSLVRDPPFSRLDLISCRNLLIYLDAELQSKVIPIFHYALRPGGIAFLGISENVSQNSDLFMAIDKKHRLFQRSDHVVAQPHLPLLLYGPRLLSPNVEQRVGTQLLGPSLRRAVDGRVLDRFAPVHVVVNRDGDVVHYSARTGKYLEAPSGNPNRQLLAMARKGLRLELRNALQEAAETRRSVRRDRIAFESDERVQLIGLTVEPINDGQSDQLYLVVFEDIGPPVTMQEAEARSRQGDLDSAQMEVDLRHVRERLQSTIEEYETAVEELKAANEELVSMNEELQSTNEELETGKEEIQSVNEELQTVNYELGSKVEQLNQANADLRNLFESTGIAVIFLDRELLIRIFTPAVTAIFNLISSDRGRPLTDIAHNLNYDTLEADISAVMSGAPPHEARVARRDGSTHYLMRILPYRTSSDDQDGALLVFVDITAPVQTEQQLRLLVRELNHRARNLLTVINALARQTAARTESVDDFVASFSGRISALARSHDLLADELWGDISLAVLVASEVEPHASNGSDQIERRGPDVRVTPRAAMAMGMILHELAVNAMKYGALGSPDGRLAISWSFEGEDGSRDLIFHWRERNGPQVTLPTATGFGTTLIERQASGGLGGKAEFCFEPNGLAVTLTLPDDSELFHLSQGGADAGNNPPASTSLRQSKQP